MTKLTFEKICDIIKSYNLYEYLFNEDEDFIENIEDSGYEGKELLDFLGFTNFKQVKHVRNSDEMYCVIHFEDVDIYILLTGEYDSYGQGEHSYHRKIKQVFPKQITITIYE